MGNWQRASEHSTKWQGQCTAGKRRKPGPRPGRSVRAPLMSPCSPCPVWALMRTCLFCLVLGGFLDVKPSQWKSSVNLPCSLQSLYARQQVQVKAVRPDLRPVPWGACWYLLKKKKVLCVFFQNHDKKKQVYKYTKISSWLRTLVVTIGLLI